MAEIKTGTDVLRDAVRVRSRLGGYVQRLARDLNVGIAALEDFAHGRGQLDPTVLSALAKEIFNAEYDAERDLLRRRPSPTLPTPVPPEPVRDGTKLRTYSSPRPRQGPLFTTEKPVPPQPRQKRPGWA